MLCVHCMRSVETELGDVFWWHCVEWQLDAFFIGKSVFGGLSKRINPYLNCQTFRPFNQKIEFSVFCVQKKNRNFSLLSTQKKKISLRKRSVFPLLHDSLQRQIETFYSFFFRKLQESDEYTSWCTVCTIIMFILLFLSRFCLEQITAKEFPVYFSFT